MTAVFKDLCINATDSQEAATFWAAALQLTAERRDGNVVLTDPDPRHTVWINRVPQHKEVKTRVHLDLHAASVADVLELGATVLDTSEPWTVCAGPDGVELCVFERAPDRLPDYRLYELGVDCADPEAVCRWWGRVLGAEVDGDAKHQWWALHGAALPYEIVFAPVPERKMGPNWIHWDVRGDTTELIAAGATLLRAHDVDGAAEVAPGQISWDVLADPEGNEFCVFVQ